MEAGMDAHIAKPVDLDLLEENIRIYMQAKALAVMAKIGIFAASFFLSQIGRAHV